MIAGWGIGNREPVAARPAITVDCGSRGASRFFASAGRRILMARHNQISNAWTRIS